MRHTPQLYLLQSTPLITQKHGNTSVTQCAHPHHVRETMSKMTKVSQEVRTITKKINLESCSHTREEIAEKSDTKRFMFSECVLFV